MYWIAASGPMFGTPEAAIADWMRDHTTLPSYVFRGIKGESIRIVTQGPMILDRIVGGIRYTLA